MNLTKILVLTGLILCFSSGCKEPSNEVQIHYLGHASFIISFDNGTSVLTDYGKPNAYLEYGWDSPIHDIGEFTPDIMTFSHFHDDHYDSTRIPAGVEHILKEDKKMTSTGLSISPILTSEKDISVTDNISYLIKYGDLKILHLGDCQANILHIDSTTNREFIEKVIPKNCDVVLLPIESTSMFIPQAAEFIDLIKPGAVIPMHYWSNTYKSGFIDYMQNRNQENKQKYKIVTTNSSVYRFSKQAEDDIIDIIDMNPSAYIIRTEN